MQFLDFDRGCIMAQQEFSQGIQQLRAWSASPQQARQYSSFQRMSADKKQHRRVDWSAQRALQEPVTAAQTVSAETVVSAVLSLDGCAHDFAEPDVRNVPLDCLCNRHLF